ncbi:MAG: hypothetical protein ACE5FU_05350, partial [Nitrospinota bacterium]
TWPKLKEYGDLFQFWYVQNEDFETASFMKKHIRGFFDVDFDQILQRNGSRLYDDLKTFLKPIE